MLSYKGQPAGADKTLIIEQDDGGDDITLNDSLWTENGTFLWVTTDANSKATFSVHDSRDQIDPNISGYGTVEAMHFTVTMADGKLKPYTDQVAINWGH